MWSRKYIRALSTSILIQHPLLWLAKQTWSQVYPTGLSGYRIRRPYKEKISDQIKHRALLQLYLAITHNKNSIRFDDGIKPVAGDRMNIQCEWAKGGRHIRYSEYRSVFKLRTTKNVLYCLVCI